MWGKYLQSQKFISHCLLNSLLLHVIKIPEAGDDHWLSWGILILCWEIIQYGFRARTGKNMKHSWTFMTTQCPMPHVEKEFNVENVMTFFYTGQCLNTPQLPTDCSQPNPNVNMWEGQLQRAGTQRPPNTANSLPALGMGIYLDRMESKGSEAVGWNRRG